MPRRVVKRSKQFIAPHLFPAPLYQLRQQNAHCVIVSNRKLMRMLAHDCTSRLQIIFALARITVDESSPPRHSGLGAGTGCDEVARKDFLFGDVRQALTASQEAR